MAGPGAPDWTQSVVDVLQGAPLWLESADVGNAATGTWTLAPPPTPEALGFVLGAVLILSGGEQLGPYTLSSGQSFDSLSPEAALAGPGTLTVSVSQENVILCEAVVQSINGPAGNPWQYFPTIIWNGSTNPGYNLFISYTFVFPPGLTVTDVNMYLAGYAQALPIPPSQSPSAVSGTVTANQGAAGSGAWPVSLPAGQAVELLDASGVNKAAVSAAGAVSVAPPNPLPVSGTVTANQGAAGSGAWPVSLPAGQAVELLDASGVNKAAVSAAGAVSVAPPNPLPVSGTVTANQGAAGSGAWPVSLPAGQAVELLDASGVNKAAVSAAGAVSVAPPNPLPVSGTVTANVAGLANPLPTSDVADVAPGAALPAKVLVIAGSDLTDARPIQTDSAGRIILGSPSTTLPVTQSTSPWLVQDAADVAPGAAVPAKALWVAGTDGTDARGLLTDTQGRLVLTPTAPSLAAGQHPVVERQWAANNFSANGNLGVPPGAGLRYRVYWVKLIYTGGTGAAYTVGPYGGILCFVGSSPYPPLDFADLKESGVAWPTNTAIPVYVGTGVSCEAAMLYTIETV
jgi:hypothetical protein